MEYSIIISGFGGQGVLTIGDMLAFSAMKAGMNVTWMPSYGVEMRGGTANCNVIISHDKIGSPIAESPDYVLAMNGPSMLKYGNQLTPGGLLFVNSTLVKDTDGLRNDIEVIMVPTGELAEESGSSRMANVVMLGAFLGKSKVMEASVVANYLEDYMTGNKKKLVPQIKKSLLLAEKKMEQIIEKSGTTKKACCM